MLALTCWSCKTEYPNLPYNDIESFSIQDADGKTLSASIVNDQIILYWPPLVEQPESITPTIKISELATITPASGTAIQLQSDKPITYTVRAQDGSSKNYTLVFQYNQPLVQAKMNLLEGKYYLSYPKNEPISIRGENILLDETQTKGYLVDKDGKETLLSFYAAPQASGIVFNTPEDLKPGIYHIKLISGRYTVLTDPFEVLLPTLYNVIKWQDMFYTGRKGGDLVLNINSREAYELYFKADFDHFIAVDNLNNEYSINNVVFDVAAMTITLPIPVSVKGDAINTLKMMDKNGKLLSVGNFNISLN
ncbi:hypothetical protein [Sphingobacterium sp.]|uniref:hypothetical protein n=1 Tax=Sphingobacterium sp. TaxID=341027 RepID=UPI00289716E9|nr:hypothetical protein [Sphingobacterium sp.]